MKHTLVVGCCALLLGACGSSAKTAVSPTTTISSSASTTTTAELSTTSLPCQPIPMPNTPVTSPTNATASPALLTKLDDISDHCVDHVVFDFKSASDPPGYTVSYGNPPFNNSGSDKPVTVAGSAFVVVRFQPGYGYDFATGSPTYTGPKSVPVSNSNHVQAIVESGDFEGVLTWVIGLDAKRPFSVQATGSPQRQVVVTIS